MSARYVIYLFLLIYIGYKSNRIRLILSLYLRITV